MKSGMAPNSPEPNPLHCPNASAIASFKAAVKRGDITWYASSVISV